ncbi:ATP-grasp domain-containing protein [Actinokineospora sp. UTMC 2448]|uniref:ATP-grasp domain-containing protein n=1 Tax=Actinokineospora sp. UTMC 2448 TaxID=2268449 RepID=UPI002164534F|nr:ATP-grasp domain-containing protein [Actinokineospora sp. UTMC 2448]UVS77502.1 Alanine-anticapsin ligase BacD [Actinokineospora sp. UTMC 2448]
MTRPVLLVGFVGVALTALLPVLGEDSVVFVEEPDVVRKRDVRPKVAESALVRELIEWEFHLPGKADEFYNAHRDLDPAAIVPLTEYATPFAARLAERYELPGAGYGAALILRDKALLRQVSAAAGIANPQSVAVSSPADVVAFMRGCPGPVVLKPANRQASVGTQVLADPADAARAWAECVVQDEGVFVPDRPMDLRMLVERFVSGHEYSVEMLVRDGESLFANVTGKQLFPGPRPVELVHVVPADIDDGLTALLTAQTLKVIDAVGFQDGIVHCEWIVADGVPHLVECAGRFAGDGIIELIQRAYPVELNRCYFAVMRGEPLPEVMPRRAAGAAAVRFLSVETGVVQDVRGVEEATRAEGVFLCDVSVEKGDTFTGLRSSWDRVGDVMVTADTPAEALRRAEAAVALIEIDVRPLASP